MGHRHAQPCRSMRPRTVMREREVGIATVYAQPYDQLHSVDFGTTMVQSVYDVKNANFVCLTCRIST